MKIRVLDSKKKTEVAVLELSETASVNDLNKEITKANKDSPWKGRFGLNDRKPLLFGKPIRDFVTAEEFEVTVKDLGPQLPYRTLFVLEYLGPLITIPICYLISKNRSDTAKFGAAIGIAHFVKRELESQFVHIFSNASVPVSGSFKNFFHYWVLYGLLTVGEIFFFKTKSSDWPRSYYWIFTTLIAIFEFCNFKCHEVLRDLRMDGSGKVDPHKRGIPRGWGFDQVLCANYMWEILTWVTYTIMTKSWMSAIFTAFGLITMSAWAKKKKRMLLDSLRDEDKGKVAKKAVLFPGLF